MASGSYQQVFVVCPFYQTDNGKDRIICEGLIPGTRTQIYFRRPSERKLQMEVFCCRHYRNCELAAALIRKYDEEEKEQ